ncbi:MAG: aspartate aminotransferase family protein [Nitrososphaerota archaeon]|nr:aspartate aminotransferase family protein [Nitrososphaerota archaeon]
MSEDEYLIPLYQKFPVKIVRGNGALVYDESGKEYIDLAAGYGVAIVGHSNPAVTSAIIDQAKKIIICHGSFYNDAREKYLELLSKHLPGNLSKIFFCNSGAEANEAAIKFARKVTGRQSILAFTGSFHGKTFGALSATWNQKYRKPFEPLIQTVKFAPFGNLEKAKELIDETVACVIVEPIQGEGGIHVSPDGFLSGLRELTKARGALLIFDEVQSGFGRTGKLWACENWGVTPDVMTVAKGVAGGVPFGFAVTTSEVSASLKPGDHSSTFGGNPLGCAAALASLDFLITNKILEKTIQDGQYFRSKLEELKTRHTTKIREVRGKGLMLAAELKVPVRDVIVKGFQHNLILLYAGLNIIRFLPPLVITRAQIDRAIEELDKIMVEIENEPPGKKSDNEGMS